MNGTAGSEAARYAAKAQFRLAERRGHPWTNIPSTDDIERQMKALKRSLNRLKKLEEKYEKVQRFEVFEYTLASQFRIGELQAEFAKTLGNAPCPSKPETLPHEKCHDLLGNRANDREKKAVVRWRRSLGDACEKHVRNEWTERMVRELREYRPDEYSLDRPMRTAAVKRIRTSRRYSTTSSP